MLSGFPVYLIAAIRAIMLDHDPAMIKFESDQETWQDENLLIVLCNGPREGGGFHVAPEAKVDDGWLDYAAISSFPTGSSPVLSRQPQGCSGFPRTFHGTSVAVILDKLEQQMGKLTYVQGKSV